MTKNLRNCAVLSPNTRGSIHYRERSKKQVMEECWCGNVHYEWEKQWAEQSPEEKFNKDPKHKGPHSVREMTRVL